MMVKVEVKILRFGAEIVKKAGLLIPVLLILVLMIFVVGPVQAQKLTGAGATFPYPIYSKWFSEYSAAHPGVEINYQSIGSGGGIRQVTAGTVDFGATDGPATDDQLAQSKTKLIHIPTV